ncbi:MAG TPA: prolipoprotein diacylglyceryl transferase [Tepidisphaeraceae bacterium]|jgi:phosphatidylglycerol:prolipoprotein diacylglycerol transferase
MMQELFRIPVLNLPIYSYGLMMVIGFLCAIQLAKYLAKRCGIDPELFVNAGLIALITGVLGARLSHVIENIGQYTTITPTRSAWDNFIDAINIRSGGLTYYGGFLLAFPSLVFYAIRNKIPLRLGMDIVAPCIVIGLGFGRIGCFLNGCCYGDRCNQEWAVTFPYHSFAYEEEFAHGHITPPPELLVKRTDGENRLLSREELRTGIRTDRDPVTNLPMAVENLDRARELAAIERSEPLHPAQLYSAFTAFLIAGIALCFFTLPHAPGRAFALVLMLEGSSRFILELLRVEPPVLGPFSLSMLIGLGVAALGAILWIVFGHLAGEAAANRPIPIPA